MYTPKELEEKAAEEIKGLARMVTKFSGDLTKLKGAAAPPETNINVML
jgi:hypothetical protein